MNALYTPDDPLYPDVEVRLLGMERNVGTIMGAVAEAIRRRYGREAEQGYREDVFLSRSFDEVLHKSMCYVWVPMEGYDEA